MAQYDLLRSGLAVVKTYYPNLKYYREYLTYSLDAEIIEYPSFLTMKAV